MLEQPEVGRLLPHGLVVAEIAVEQEIIHLDGGGGLAHLVESFQQLFGDLGLPGGGWPGQGDEDRGSPGFYEILDHLNEGLVDLPVGFPKIQVTDILDMLELVLAGCEGAERFPAEVGQPGFCEIDRAGQEVEAAQVKIEQPVHPILAVFPLYQANKEHPCQTGDACIQHDAVFFTRLGMNVIIKLTLADRSLDLFLRIELN